MRTLLLVLGFSLLCGATSCTQEDGQPYPPLQMLVPCSPDAPDGSPLSCPDLRGAGDGGADGGSIGDGGAGDGGKDMK
jgi:hypothetical protein